MSHPHTSSAGPRNGRRVALASLLAAACAVLFPSCGGGGSGGGGLAGVDTGGTGSFISGRVTGFGSVIVNGVRFEDGAARVFDEDDEARTFGPQDLRLGMVVQVQGGAIVAGTADQLPSATASAIAIESQIKGPVESRTAPDTLVVFGQTVKVNAATVFDGTSFAAIVTGDVLEVSGFADASGVVMATRIEREGTPDVFKVRGVIAGLDAVARTFRIGAATFNFADPAVRLPDAPLANGQFVRVRTQTVRNTAGQWVVTRMDRRNRVEDRDEAEVEGILAASSGGGLQINGLPIDFSRMPAGFVPPVGQRVEVEGELVGGVLVAREVELEDEDARVDVRGTASSVNRTAQTFVVRGVTFHYSAATEIKDGSIAVNLVDGASVRARGTIVSGTAPVEATEIDFDP